MKIPASTVADAVPLGQALTVRQGIALQIFCALTANGTHPSVDLRAKRSWEMADLWMASETEKG
jgi:hypothetical protein